MPEELHPPPSTTPITTPGNGRAQHPWVIWFTLVFTWLKVLIADAAALLASFLVEHNANGTHKFPFGTWTVTIGGTGGQSGQTYAQQEAFYTKAGRLVHAICRVQLSTLGTITGAVQIKGLPFPALNNSGHRATAPVIWAMTATAYVNIVAVVNPNSSVIDLVATAAATTDLSVQNLAQANLTNTTRFVVSVLYEADQ